MHLILSANRMGALKAALYRHNNAISKVLLGSKETLDKKKIIESAFRACKEAFLKLSAAYLGLLEGSTTAFPSLIDIKEVVTEFLLEFGSINPSISVAGTPHGMGGCH